MSTAPDPTTGPRLLTPAQAADYCGVTEDHLRRVRKIRQGPPYHRIGHKTVRYARDDLDTWLETVRVETRP